MSARKAWSASDDELLRTMFAESKPDREIGAALGRTGTAVELRRAALGLKRQRP